MSWHLSYYQTGDLVSRYDYQIYFEDFRINNEIEVVSRLLTQHNISNITLLNLACGPNAAHSIALVKEHAISYVDHIDINKQFLELNRTHFNATHKHHQAWLDDEKCQYIEMDMQALEQQKTDRKYNCICLFGNSFGFFEHSVNLTVLKSLYQRLDNGGLLFLTVPKYNINLARNKSNPFTFSVNKEDGTVFKSSRTYNKDTQQSDCITEKYINGLLEETTHRSIAIYPIEINEPGKYSYRKFQQLLGFRSVELEKLPHNPNSNGLMMDLDMIVFQK
ncbi:hypothetical protein C9J03_11420 [Photobacterium gaetbulicola]|uniref:Methyltransferase domain-containing protein n=1 Tax=Photobacterium gaetbulicola Gung47 TaxID=658445 RepID=A0A0C5WQ22_9GAMM|nr:hypothetical protein [Photobacterium gaetbulicola]AJR09208.1 hypothetical protein H744_2c2552 [Photobacterium gaetbulicola Gung47]PSU11741.1 hypothetical protein C9J03_11420 [Photobacterium gaetbulicola]